MSNKIENPSCSECGQLHCYRHDKKYPDFCLTESIDENQLRSSIETYQGDSYDAKVARAAAEVEGLYYCKITRVEEVVAFAKRIDAKKIGIASCLGLIEETRIFTKVLRLAGFEPFTALCKVGSVDKSVIGIDESLKIKCGSFEACCNPIVQAQLLNQEHTDLNVIMGLCVGHDALFTKYSEALVTSLVTKDRVNGHNPAVALYSSKMYGKRILDPDYLKSL
ncbi:DUF1847 domain-containing protein [Rhodocyclus tenuis]|uniref:DUF1847 domain-containing protein n=2 Tax=Rhodocyclus TaxID=1064 RepID=A0A6L5JZ66_RHOTE|nr:DUF1847 domain-containing protein [Rhodocyclus gracilis]MQY52386.1 DUF1847 domain-containing protein [Rhodocyclus gracilis]NJA88293.1 DUF1847 domain-containing protein [Rhodocyclus gracilis]